MGGGPPGFPRDFTCPAVLWCHLSASNFAYGTVTRSGRAFQRCLTRLPLLFDSPQPQSTVVNWFGLFPLRSPLLRKSIFLSLPPVTKMFQFAGLHLHNYVFIMQYLRITISVFPHSEISGSKLTYSSPKHIVVRHVLHQLLVPRHSPYALSNLITIFCFFLICE